MCVCVLHTAGDLPKEPAARLTEGLRTGTTRQEQERFHQFLSQEGSASLAGHLASFLSLPVSPAVTPLFDTPTSAR